MSKSLSTDISIHIHFKGWLDVLFVFILVKLKHIEYIVFLYSLHPVWLEIWLHTFCFHLVEMWNSTFSALFKFKQDAWKATEKCFSRRLSLQFSTLEYFVYQNDNLIEALYLFMQICICKNLQICKNSVYLTIRSTHLSQKFPAFNLVSL